MFIKLQSHKCTWRLKLTLLILAEMEFIAFIAYMGLCFGFHAEIRVDNTLITLML